MKISMAHLNWSSFQKSSFPQIETLADLQKLLSSAVKQTAYLEEYGPIKADELEHISI